MRLLSFLFAFLFLLSHRALALAPHPLGSPRAVKGGSIVVGLAGYPKYLMYWLGYDELSEAVSDLVQEPLVEADQNTWEIMPRIAKQWTFSKDKKTITFQINPDARFSDGHPITAEDVKFTWDTVMDPKNKTVPWQSFFGSFESCTQTGPMTVVFQAKEAHFKNLEKLVEFFILPKHYYARGDFNKDFGTRMLGSGPYTIEEAVQGEKIVFKRNPEYWGAKLAQNEGRFNFDRIVFKAVPDYDVQFEMFKKGEIDYFYFLISKMWATQTDSLPFKNHYLVKLKGDNKLPYSTPGIAWNLRRPLFQDRRVRLALSHLLNRKKLIHELFYDNYGMATGAVPLHSVYHAPKNEPIEYSPKEASRLLKEAGWEKTGSDGVLVNGQGQRFEFELLLENPALVRAMTGYQEDLKALGIKMSLRALDWATMLRLTDDRQFDAALINRSREIHPSDFAGMWGSPEADKKGSANVTGYKNPEVDRLAKEIDATFDEKKRVKLVRELDEILGHDQPMTFTWETLFFRVGYWNRFSFPGKGFFDLTYWRNAFHYWWYDEAKDKKLKAAMAKGVPFQASARRSHLRLTRDAESRKKAGVSVPEGLQPNLLR